MAFMDAGPVFGLLLIGMWDERQVAEFGHPEALS